MEREGGGEKGGGGGVDSRFPIIFVPLPANLDLKLKVRS